MLRRDFLLMTAAISLALPLSARAATAYDPATLKADMAAGKTIFLDFKADWCSTCRAQERVIGALRAENPAYDDAITFVNVDWDLWKDGDLVRDMNIPRRSTLVVLKGETELGRIVAGTGRAEIKALLDLALGAAG
jgi:thiol-disulfide isomerase/thioredoxin